MAFMSFSSTQPAQKYEMPEMELTELTARLDRIKESIDNIQVVFEPKIEVPPAQIGVEVDLTNIENALQDLARKDYEPIHNVTVAAPSVTNNVHVTIGQELIYPLYSIVGALMLLVIVVLAGYFR
jgi:hypothetical protein